MVVLSIKILFLRMVPAKVPLIIQDLRAACQNPACRIFSLIHIKNPFLTL
jgi:hypothetical protein